MELLNRALEQVIDQLVSQKITTLRLEIESQKKTILDLSLRIEKRENEVGKKMDDLQRQNRLLMAKMLLMENEKILQNDNSNENGSNLSNEENPTGTKDTSISIYKNSENSEGQFPIDAIETIDNITNNISEIFKTEVLDEESTEIDSIEPPPKKEKQNSNYLSAALLNTSQEDFSRCLPIGDGRVKCLICERELKRDSWKRHISSVHSNNRPYTCEICHTTFKLAHDMYKHKRLKHGENDGIHPRGKTVGGTSSRKRGLETTNT